jgi:CYTH domain-containing protein
MTVLRGHVKRHTDPAERTFRYISEAIAKYPPNTFIVTKVDASKILKTNISFKVHKVHESDANEFIFQIAYTGNKSPLFILCEIEIPTDTTNITIPYGDNRFKPMKTISKLKNFIESMLLNSMI